MNFSPAINPLNLIQTIICAIACLQLSSMGSDSPVAISATLNGTNLDIFIEATNEIKEVELRFHSSRNQNISEETDISIHDPNRREKLVAAAKLDHNFWYPVVDMELEPGFKGVARFENGPEVQCLVNGPYWKRKTPMKSRLTIPAEQLEHWENSIRVDSRSRKLERFYLSNRMPLITGRLEHRFALLSKQWSGKIELYTTAPGKIKKLAEAVIEAIEPIPSAKPFNGNLDTENLLNALRGSLDFTLRSQNKNPQSPSFGGLNLFYDTEATTYRTSYWMWGWGPSIRLLLDASQRPEFSSESRRMLSSAKEIGDCTLGFLWHAPGTPLDRIALSRWDRGSNIPNGFQGAITFADSLFLAGWAWIPIYETFGDVRYLELTRRLSDSSNELMNDFKVLPHSYWVDRDEWSDFTLDECGFGMEGYAEAYRVTGNEIYRQVGRRFLQQHIDTLEQPNGGWGRLYKRKSGTVSPSTTHTRGQGWAMEGLLAAHRLLPDDGHLKRCREMADNFVDSQLESGCWAWNYDRSVEDVGISEKGTALWSYLLFRTYAQTGDERYLESARKALAWCLENRYDGPDPEAHGSIIGRTNQSAVGYRQWYDISCVYTSAFFGLAILEELKLQ